MQTSEQPTHAAETSAEISEIATALAKAQSQIEGASKDKTNPHYKSKYADLASTWHACRDALTANGIGVVQLTRYAEKDEVIVVTRLVHSSGQWMRGELNLPVSRADAQGFGSALTYARRYALAAAVGVSPEDDDGQAAAAAKPDYSVRLVERSKEKPITAMQEAHDTLSSMAPDQQVWLKEQAMEIIGIAEKGGDCHAHIDAQKYDTEEKLALWSLLPSNVRSTIKKQQQAARLGSQA
jgi:hypothetical protein